MGFIWFLLGGIAGSWLTGKVASTAGGTMLSLIMNKLDELPEPCRTEVKIALGSMTEADIVRAYGQWAHLPPGQMVAMAASLPPEAFQPLVHDASTGAAIGGIFGFHGYRPYPPAFYAEPSEYGAGATIGGLFGFHGYRPYPPAFYAEPEYGTGQWGTPVARCQDASANVPLCAAAAAALATETDATKLRNFAAQVSAMGYPKAAEALRVKASMISG